MGIILTPDAIGSGELNQAPAPHPARMAWRGDHGVCAYRNPPAARPQCFIEFLREWLGR
jgi:hypothetical protein